MTLFSHLQIWLEHWIESQLIKNISTENRFEFFLLLQWSKCGMKFMDFLDLVQWFSSLIGISLKPVVNQFAKVAAILNEMVEISKMWIPLKCWVLLWYFQECDKRDAGQVQSVSLPKSIFSLRIFSIPSIEKCNNFM